MKKTARQETCSINQPPRTGPIAAVIALKPDQVPIARPRSSSRKELLMMARLPGTSNAAPNPWTARAIIKERIPEARPHHAEAAPKMITPMTKTCRRP